MAASTATKDSPETGRESDSPANIAVIGAGWWSQGWHLPALKNNPRSNLVAIVDPNPSPTSRFATLEPLATLANKYGCPTLSSTEELLEDLKIGPHLDGVLVATPHATHCALGKVLLAEAARRRQETGSKNKPLHIFMEKPMTTDIDDALELYQLVKEAESSHATKAAQFWINHSANYRLQTGLAREAVASGRLGRIRHVTASFASPTKWIFEDNHPGNDAWNKPSGRMLGNGFAWGQSSHLLAFVFHVLPDLEPMEVYCRMHHSPATGADLSHAATVGCRDARTGEAVLVSLTGTALLPGHQYTDPPVAKLVDVAVYGTDGSLHYGGNDLDPTSGRLEVRRGDGSAEILCDRFEFEGYDHEHYGPESLRGFVDLCCGNFDGVAGANVTDGLRSVQVLDAMYKSHASKKTEPVIQPPSSSP